MDKISIISNSLIVNELLKIIFKKRRESPSFIEESDIETLFNSIVIIDDSITDLETAIENLKLQNNRVILLGESSSPVEYRVEKPFLPQDIEALLEKIQEVPKSTIKKSEIKTNILDPDEIAHIKALMDLEDDAEESTLTALEKVEERVSFKIKGKEAKEFLLSLTELDPKALKKALKKSRVSIKITFQESSDA